MEGYYYGYCILEQTRIRDEKYRKKHNSQSNSASSSTSSLSSLDSNSDQTRRQASRLSPVDEKKPMISNQKKHTGYWIYNKIYNTFN